jgi:carbonic anhydrase
MAETSGISRRDLFRLAAAGGVTTAVGLNLGEGGPRAAAADTSTPDGALQALVDGNARFLAHNMTSFNEDLTLINSGIPESHTPFAAILSCADARVSPEIVFDQVMGDLFVTRVAGNVASPEIIASLEYAVAVLDVKLIMVVGHGLCGAVSAADRRTVVTQTQISSLYAYLRPAVNIAGTGESFAAKAQLNARIQAILLQDSSPLIASRVGAIPQTLRVVPAYYNLVATPPGPPPGAPPNGAVTILPIPPLTPAAP